MNKETFIDWFITFQQYVGTGKGLFSFITEPLKLIIVGGAFVFPEWVKENVLASIAGVLLLYLIIPYALGWWWDERRYYHRQAEWGNKRNPLAIELRANMERKI